MTNQNSRQRDDFEIFIPLQLEDLALKLKSAFYMDIFGMSHRI